MTRDPSPAKARGLSPETNMSETVTMAEKLHADWRLCGAAPDLLAALQAVMAEWRDGYGLKCADQCRAAIAKATGASA